jgi:GH15 family glucan-1,4-alpha-glucosidase
MPRDLIFSNGQFLVNLDKHLNIRDIYFPYVGQLNHVAGHRCRIGVWTADVGFAWIDDEWQRDLAYGFETSVSDCVAKINRLGLTLRFRQGVAPDENLFFQHIAISNQWRAERSVRVFFAFDLRIDESDIGDTAFYHPYSGSLIHYKRDRYILASGYVGDEPPGSSGNPERGIKQYACGIKEFGGAEGTWRDAEDGVLSNNAIAQGSVDSVIGFELTLKAEGKERLNNWIAVGRDLDSVLALHARAMEDGLEPAIKRTETLSRKWAGSDPEGLSELPDRVANLFRRSVLIVRAQIDRGGAILASTDSDIMLTARAHYAYVWPRDGALVASPMDRIGANELTAPFFRFCRDAIAVSPQRIETPDGSVAALMHKYCPDGSLGASWHPWTVLPDDREVPIQEDGTALVVWAGVQHAESDPSPEHARQLYSDLIRPAARFLVEYRCPVTALPRPSWDVWEERRGVHLFTTSAVVAALDRASRLAATMGDATNAARFKNAASETRSALEKHFWDEERERFVRTLTVDRATGDFVKDYTVDSSMYAVFGYGALPADHPKVASTMGAIGRSLWVKVGIGGLARYEDDYYFRIPSAGDVKQVPGNPWIICTLWLAEWMIATAKSHAELESALDLMEWAAVCALPTGILPEQIHPVTYEPLSVAPLTWSHAQFLTTVLNYLDRRREIG